MEKKVMESIFSGKVGCERMVIPMADVQHIEIEEWGTPKKNSYIVVTCHTKKQDGKYLNAIKLKHHMGGKFMKAWTEYRADLEAISNPYEDLEEIDNQIAEK